MILIVSGVSHSYSVLLTEPIQNKERVVAQIIFVFADQLNLCPRKSQFIVIGDYNQYIFELELFSREIESNYPLGMHRTRTTRVRLFPGSVHT
jgi:hypothetical protein